MKALCVLSESGVSAESSTLRFPAVTLRSSIEMPEALDSGSIIMTDLRPESVTAGIDVACADNLLTAISEMYRVQDCTVRVRNFILFTAFEPRTWAGLR